MALWGGDVFLFFSFGMLIVPTFIFSPFGIPVSPIIVLCLAARGIGV